MLSGTVIFAHQDPLLAIGAERALHMTQPGIHIERTSRGKEALMMHSLMRADAVLMEMNLPDMPGAHLLHELKRDIANPYVMVCSRDRSPTAERKALRMGANSYMPTPVDVMRLVGLIEEELKRRAASGGTERAGLSEVMLQRIFMDYGLQCDLKGYVFLKCALILLNSGEVGLGSMGLLYERIGEKHGCTPGAVEHAMRYAVDLCWKRMDRKEEKKPGNREFLIRLLEESRTGNQSILRPRVSVFCSGRRVFR